MRRREGDAPRRWWVIGFRVASILGGIVAGTLLVEIAARVLFPNEVAQLRLPASRFEPSDIAGIPYLLRPGVEGWTNNLALCNPHDTAVEKAPGTFRLLIAGDSVSALRTDGATPDLLYPNVLETLLAGRAAMPVEVLNLSSPGLSTEQELALIRARGLRLDPDAILVAYAANDPLPTDIDAAPNIESRWFMPLQLLRLWEYQRAAAAPAEWYRPDSDVFRRLDATFGALERLAGERTVVLVPLPLRTADAARQIHFAPVAELCRRHGLRCIDIYPRMLPYLASVPQGETTDLLHYDSAGHRAIAEALVDPVTELVAESRRASGRS